MSSENQKNGVESTNRSSTEAKRERLELKKAFLFLPSFFHHAFVSYVEVWTRMTWAEIERKNEAIKKLFLGLSTKNSDEKDMAYGIEARLPLLLPSCWFTVGHKPLMLPYPVWTRLNLLFGEGVWTWKTRNINLIAVQKLKWLTLMFTISRISQSSDSYVLLLKKTTEKWPREDSDWNDSYFCSPRLKWFILCCSISLESYKIELFAFSF